MSDIPPPESFNTLSKVAEICKSKAWRDIDSFLKLAIVDGISDEAVPELAKACEKIIECVYEEALGDGARSAITWLESEPAFIMAFRDLGFYKTPGRYWLELMEREVKHRLRLTKKSENPWSSMISDRFYKHRFSYIVFVSQISEAIYMYTSGIGHRAVIEGPPKIARLKTLLNEIDSILGADWIPDQLHENLIRSLRTERARQQLEDYEEAFSPASQRNDADLPTRLFAMALLRTNRQLFNSFHKKAVFHLTGLPFVNRSLEMRTIERLAKSEMDAMRESMAKKISDRKGLDFNDVLTALKSKK